MASVSYRRTFARTLSPRCACTSGIRASWYRASWSRATSTITASIWRATSCTARFASASSSSNRTPEGEWSSFHIENARSAGASRNFNGACYLIDDAPRYSGAVRTRTHREGVTYTLSRGVFHDTQTDALAITLCTMREKRGSARLLVPTGREPVHAFGERAPQAVLDAVHVDALEALRPRGTI